MKNTWHEFALKQMLNIAAAEGYDAIAWTTGEQQAQRYNLTKVVSEIEHQESGKGGWYLVARDSHGQIKYNSRVKTEKDLEALLGKETAAKIMRGEGSNTYDKLPGVKTLKAKDLKIGGKWAENLYDKAIPSFLKKYGKAWGVSPEKATVSGDTAATHMVVLSFRKGENDLWNVRVYLGPKDNIRTPPNMTMGKIA